MEHAQKLEEVRSMLNESVGESTFEVLLMIDAIQRLGIDYHFHDEIEAILKTQYRMFTTTADHHRDDLYEVALRFRLLRQQGYYVTADVFNQFKDKEGNFEENDIRGLMGLYEASQLMVQGEDILEEARNFTRQNLDTWSTAHSDDQHLARIVRNTLGHAHHKSLARFMAKRFLTYFRGTNEWIDPLRELAKMEFHMVKSIHQQEILQVTKWWENLGLAKELKFARNQPLKWYMWPLAVLPDPSLSEQRVELTKPISLVYIIDDIFDVHGTLDELTLFTEAVNRWEYEVVGQLPDYMKTCFNDLNGITNEISSKVYKDYGWNPIDSLRKSWASLCNAFLVEARWFGVGHVPKSDEYLKNGIISSGVHVGLVHMFFLLGHDITRRNVDIVDDFPGIISSVATILRLWDDLGSAKMVERLRFGKGVEVCKKPTTEMVHVPMAVLPHPSLSKQRVELAKPISLVNIIDYIFDVHGTLDELTLFTEAVNRWEYEVVEHLPDYMKTCFNALNGITNEISSKVYEDYGWNPTYSLQKSWASLCNAFLVEARWFGMGHVPKTDENLKNGIISSGVHVVLVHMFFLLGHGITRRNVDIVDDFPGIISSAATILRLWDDLGSAKDENQEGHDGSYLECYMKENPGTSIENARRHVMHSISETWKLLNQQCLAPNQFSPWFTKACLNVGRMVPLMYDYDDNQCLPSLEEHMKSLF